MLNKATERVYVKLLLISLKLRIQCWNSVINWRTRKNGAWTECKRYFYVLGLTVLFTGTRTTIYRFFRTSYPRDDPRSAKLLDIYFLRSSGAVALKCRPAPGSDRLRRRACTECNTCQLWLRDVAPAGYVICDVTVNGAWPIRSSRVLTPKCRVRPVLNDKSSAVDTIRRSFFSANAWLDIMLLAGLASDCVFLQYTLHHWLLIAEKHPIHVSSLHIYPNEYRS